MFGLDLTEQTVLLLVVSPLLAAILAIGVDLLARAGLPHTWKHRLQDAITVIASIISLLLALWISRDVLSGPIKFSVAVVNFYVDALSVYFVLLVNVIALAASFYVGPYLLWLPHRYPDVVPKPTRFHIFFNLFHFTMVLVPVVDNLVFLWIAVELTTVASAFLVGYREDRRSLEAAWKYTVITSTGIILALLGTLFFVLAISGKDTTMQWSQLFNDLYNQKANVSEYFVYLSFMFVLVGYGTKAGFAPMHTWLPDGHGEAPYPVSALLSGVLLKSALYALLRFYTLATLALGKENTTISSILLGSGLLSLLVAVPFILKPNRFKRVLAYHSLEHMGIITFGLGIGGKVALFGALLHALNHALTKALMFLAFGTVQGSYAHVRGEEKTHYVGILRAMPFTGLAMALGGLALVGSPPFNIFFSEFLILWGAFKRALDSPSLSIIAAIVLFLLSVTLIFGGLVRHLGRMLIGVPPEGVTPERPAQWIPLFALLAVVFLFGITVPDSSPLKLLSLLNKSVQIVSGGK